MSDLLMKMPAPYEPKLTNRWLIRFKGDYKKLTIGVPSKTSRPRWKSSTPDKYINNTTWGIGGAEWENIDIYLRDPISTSTTSVLMNAFNLSGKKKKIKYDLEMLDATGVVIEKWKIKGLVEEFDFGELDYAKDSLVEIKLVIKPTKVRLVS
jgi:hypothetical protein